MQNNLFPAKVISTFLVIRRLTNAIDVYHSTFCFVEVMFASSHTLTYSEYTRLSVQIKHKKKFLLELKLAKSKQMHFWKQ